MAGDLKVISDKPPLKGGTLAGDLKVVSLLFSKGIKTDWQLCCYISCHNKMLNKTEGKLYL